MEKLETIWRMLVVALVVWRLSRLFLLTNQFRVPSSVVSIRMESFLGHRLMGLLYWFNVWISARTALWVACGFCVVCIVWLLFIGISRLVTRLAGRSRSSSLPPKSPMLLCQNVPHEGLSCLIAEQGMQTNHG